jgi:hypothetical protein
LDSGIQKQCILEKKSISGTLSCVVQPMFSSDSVIVEHLGSTCWGGAGLGMGKQKWGGYVLKVKEEGKNGSSLPNDLTQKQQECCSLPF